MTTRDRMAALSPAQRELLRRRLATRPTDRRSGPLSAAQRRMWFLSQWDTEDPAYHVRSVLRLTGPLDAPLLARCVREVAERHRALRTAFTSVDGEPTQTVLDEVTVEVTVEEVGSPEEARRYAAEEVRRPFDLTRPPLARARVLRIAEHDHVLLLTVHHIVCDGSSMSTLHSQISRLYDARRREPTATARQVLPETDTEYLDFVDHQRARESDGRLDADLTFWRNTLDGAPPLLRLPTDRPRPARRSHRGALRPFTVDDAVLRGLRRQASESGATVFMTLLACYAVVLATHAETSDIVIGTPVAGRPRSAFAPVVGLFVTMLPIRTTVDSTTSFAELLRHTRHRCLDAFEHQDCPLERLVDGPVSARAGNHHPIFQVALAMQSSARRTTTLDGVTATPWPVDSGTAKFDLLLDVTEFDDRLTGHWEYDSALFDPSTIDAYHHDLLAVARAVIDTPTATVGELGTGIRGRLSTRTTDRAARIKADNGARLRRRTNRSTDV